MLLTIQTLQTFTYKEDGHDGDDAGDDDVDVDADADDNDTVLVIVMIDTLPTFTYNKL